MNNLFRNFPVYVRIVQAGRRTGKTHSLIDIARKVSSNYAAIIVTSYPRMFTHTMGFSYGNIYIVDSLAEAKHLRGMSKPVILLFDDYKRLNEVDDFIHLFDTKEVYIAYTPDNKDHKYVGIYPHATRTIPTPFTNVAELLNTLDTCDNLGEFNRMYRGKI